jgi:hypothetical protein
MLIIERTTTIRLYEVFDFHVSPSLLKVFSDQATMTMFRLVFAAQEASTIKQCGRHHVFDPTRPHQAQKFTLIPAPVRGTMLLVGVKHLLRRREAGDVHVVDIADRLYEVLEIIAFREASKLRNVVQPNINQSACTRPMDFAEERFRRFLGKPDRE